MNDIERYVEQRNRVLIDLDVEEFYRLVPELHASVMDPRFVAANLPDVVAKKRRMVALAAMHKARYEVPSIPSDLRHVSRVWLTRHGYNRLRELPWPPAGELP